MQEFNHYEMACKSAQEIHDFAKGSIIHAKCLRVALRILLPLCDRQKVSIPVVCLEDPLHLSELKAVLIILQAHQREATDEERRKALKAIERAVAQFGNREFAKQVEVWLATLTTTISTKRDRFFP